MATSTKRKSTASKATSGNKKSPAKKPVAKRTNSKRRNTKEQKEFEQHEMLRQEVIIWSALAFSILLFFSNLGICGNVGEILREIGFGLFGLIAYLIPFAIFFGTAFMLSNRRNRFAKIKLAAAIILLCMICLLLELMTFNATVFYAKSAYWQGVEEHTGGGAIGGALAGALYPNFGFIGAYIIALLLGIVSVVILTERSLYSGVRKKGQKLYHTAKQDAKRYQQAHREHQRTRVREAIAEPVEEALPVRRMDRKVSGVVADTRIYPKMAVGDNLSQISPESIQLVQEHAAEEPVDIFEPAQDELVFDGIFQESEQAVIKRERIRPTSSSFNEEVKKPKKKRKKEEKAMPITEETGEKSEKAPVEVIQKQPKQSRDAIDAEVAEVRQTTENVVQMKKYRFPKTDLLAPVDHSLQGDSKEYLTKTAGKLQQTLQNFGVNVTITHISCGPTVTRYELQPEMGVKVSKIVNLTDDIKLNLAAADIRMEAPIPGKAAIGIEVPNKETVPVAFRELVESKEFQEHKSKIAFVAGKDIAGKVIVADIAKMPHLLIAGATGSGKSVCINTIIMSILYKAHPDDVKLIMIDPKVVELSVYNGIPHLFIPVVTDPKKAAGALHWAVSEMTDRYQKFAKYNVRDLNGYNKKVEALKDIEDDKKPEKMPQIVIIVDELADLMMVAPGDVEDAICRLAQLARAAGIHLILATQRPSVNVITGLIKANMPSRIAFSVSSGVDSRTILDMNGAEKLLGKGDMLFYPQGYPKPVRVQGAFVSDREVSDVVEFLKNENEAVSYRSDLEEKISKADQEMGQASQETEDTRDAYFVQAGMFLIEKDKASIGLLQRQFKVGFNRAARIMDQLEEAGVVGPEEGTRPRKILMSASEFETFVEEYV